jgi:hypothetical protein
VDGPCRNGIECLTWSSLEDATEEEPSAIQLTILGLDLARRAFQVHGVVAAVSVVVRRWLKRSEIACLFAVLRRLGLKRLQAMLHRGQIVALPHAAHPRWRGPIARAALAPPRPEPGPRRAARSLDRQLDHRLLDLRRGAVLQDRLPAADLLRRQLAFVVQLLKPIKAVAAVPHHLAGLADIAELAWPAPVIPTSPG